ncbi:aminopeptidase Ey [Drosophila virilis]|uniref:Aminopeptidase n=1 Tax=Drosophila virilis TaxID=7244 RepID=B4LPL8_DROVI|nr:aminopeptidase Ey [Drosophila virilis]XP_032293172.1 aminopeptidase Ey [Drosophila virilis]XP_032293173.1 aminopeptidase Ey [Drosophila virilis]XP_032293174.1 aminopeptidase Ey [Drosophila virilis]EDW60256.1 uncharacterized protein Dvir_GJ20962 [Drosophila virilis]
MRELSYYLVSLLLATGVLSSYNAYRLPTALKPQHYDLRILTHLTGPDELRFEGRVKIDFQILQETRNITLHAKNLTIDEANISLTSLNGSNYSITNIEVNEKCEFYIMHLAEKLQLTERYRLIMPFKSMLNANDTGYYCSSFDDSVTKQAHYLAATQFSPTYARTAFPCFDEPHLRATFRVTLGYHKNYTGLSNTPVNKCVVHDTLEDYVWCEHEPLLSTSTYLVAYAVHNLTSVPARPSDTVHKVTFRSWMQPKVVEESSFLVEFAPKALSYLERLLEYTFPLHKVDQLALPTHKFSAMENWGLVTFKQSHFVHNDEVEMQQTKENKASTVAHEYAHQWFGNLVAIKWWNDLWLKEGPSTYFGYLTLKSLMPEWGSFERSIANDLALFFYQDMFNDTIAISRSVNDSKSILEQFTPYVYKKGSLTIRMLHMLLGNDVFFTGIRNYVDRHAYDSVAQSDLWQAMQEAAVVKGTSAAAIPLSTVMDSWTLQRGYPLVSVIRNYTAGFVRVNQTRFMLATAGEDKNDESCWWIPLTFVNQLHGDFEQTQPQFWLECPGAEKTVQLINIPSPDEWLMLNPQVNSIYRVNYDERNWRMIIDTLNSDDHFRDIHVLNRAQLVDDLLALASTKHQSYELAFRMLEYLPRERELLPWNTAIEVLNKLGALFRDEMAMKFRLFMRKLVAPLYGRCPQINSVELRTKSSPSIAVYRLAYNQACRYGVDDCVRQAVRYTQGTEYGTEVPVNYRDIMYCTSIGQGNDMLFHFVRERFQNLTADAIKEAWATELGCSPDFSQLQSFLDYLLQATDKTTYSYYIQAVTSALRRQHVAPETADHILKHATILNNKFSSKEIKMLLLTIIGNSYTELEEHQLRQQLKGLSKFEEHLREAFNMRAINRDWLTQRAEYFIRALSKYL